MEQRVAERIANIFAMERLPKLLGYDKRNRLPPTMPVFPLKEFEDYLEKWLPHICDVKPTKFIQEWSYEHTRHFDSFADFMTKGQNDGEIVRHGYYPMWFLVDKLKHILHLESYDSLVFWDSLVVVSIKTGQGNGQSLWLSPHHVMNIILNTYHHLFTELEAKNAVEMLTRQIRETTHNTYWPVAVSVLALIMATGYYLTKNS